MEKKQQLMQRILSKGTSLLKLQTIKKKGFDQKFHILYCTFQKSTEKIYIGIHSSIKEKDNYLGCGITCNIVTITNAYARALRRSHLWKAVLKYGVEDFQRIDLFYFDSRQELIRAEKAIVTRDFVNRIDVFNSTLGGGMPPANSGNKNGNYGNKWTEQQKQTAKDYFKENRDTKRGKNNRAVKCVSIDIFNKEVKQHNCGRDLAEHIGVTNLTIATWLSKADSLSANVRGSKYICFLKTDYKDKVQSNKLNTHIQTVILHSRLINKPKW